MRKITLLLLAGVLFAVAPASVSADWNDGGVEAAGETIEFTGTVQTSIYHCNPTYKLKHTGTFWDTDTGWEFDKTGTHCTPIGTVKALGCTAVTNIVSENLPWSGEIAGEVVNVSGAKVKVTFSGGFFCPKTVTVEGSLTETPDNTSAISAMTLSGTMTSSLGTNVTVGGELEVLGSAQGTFGI